MFQVRGEILLGIELPCSRDRNAEARASRNDFLLNKAQRSSKQKEAYGILRVGAWVSIVSNFKGKKK